MSGGHTDSIDKAVARSRTKDASNVTRTINNQMKIIWETDSPTIGAIEQFFGALKEAGAPPNSRVEIYATEGQYGRDASCSMVVRWATPVEP